MRPLGTLGLRDLEVRVPTACSVGMEARGSLLPSDESEERRSKLVKKLERILNDEWPGEDIKVHVFGSSGNLLSSSDSDVDICVTTPFRKLESMHSLAALLYRRT